MIDEKLAAFIEGPVMIILAVADRAGRPTIGKGVGARFDAGSITVLVSRRQWPGLAGSIAPGAKIAATFCRAADYTTYQVKGRIVRFEAPTSVDRDFAERYAGITRQTLGGLGVDQALIDQWVPTDDLVRLDFTPAAVFLQTPGPGAGQPLGALQ